MQVTYNGPAREGWEPGTAYFVNTQKMTGNIYKSLSDKKGKPDTRVMVWKKDGAPNLITIPKEELQSHFNEAY